MAKAISGEGSIRKRKSGKLAGKWRVQWSYEDPISRELVQVDRTFPTQGEAADYLKDLKAKVHTGQRVEDASRRKALTLTSWFDELADERWLEEGMSAKTINYRRGRFNKYVRGSDMAGLPMALVDVDRARRLFRSLKDQGVGVPTLAALKADLVKVFNDAIDTYEKLPNMRNPFSKVRTETPEARDAIAINPEQARAAIDRLTSVHDRAFLGLFLLAGVRMSEHMALCKEQIDFERGILVIDRAVKFGERGQQTVGLPKGDKVRIAVLCPSLAALLRPLMATPGEHLFGAAMEDKPRMKKLFYSTWRRIAKEARLPAAMEPRDCRLSHNNWIEKLMPTVSTSTRLEHMGHSTTERDEKNKGIAVNIKNYTRFLSDAHDILRSEIQRVVGIKGAEEAGEAA